MPRPKVLIVYNSSLYVVKFRLPLIRRLQAEGHDVVVLAPKDEATPELRKSGARYIPLKMSQYGMNPIAEIATMWRIRSVMVKEKPAVSLHYTIKPNIFGTMAARLSGVPVINNVAGAGRAFSGGDTLFRRFIITLYRRAFRHSSIVFFQNNDDRDSFLAARAVAPAQVRRIPGSGVDLARHKPSPLPQGPVKFLFIGRLLREKGVHELLQAARLLSKSHPSARVDLVGEHEDRDIYLPRAEIEQAVAEGVVTWHGAVPPDRIPELIGASSCVVLPSYYGEGVPRSLLEACASGRPIITTDNVGCRDVVEHGRNGLMVMPRDVEALAQAMRDFAELAPEARQAMGDAARAKAEREFDEEIVLSAYLRAIAEVLKRPRETDQRPMAV